MTTYYGGSLDTSFGTQIPYKFQKAPTLVRTLFAPLPRKGKVNMSNYKECDEKLTMWEKDYLPKNVKQAEFHLKILRAQYPTFLVSLFQLWYILLLSLLFPDKHCEFTSIFQFGTNHLCNVAYTYFHHVFCYEIIFVTIPLYIIVGLLTRFISGPKKFQVDENMRLKVIHGKVQSFVLYPVLLGLLMVAYFLLFMHVYDTEYSTYADNLETMEGVGKEISSTLGEKLFVIRLIIFFAAVEFVVDNLENGEFTMEMPTSRVKWTMAIMVLTEMKNNVKKSFTLGLVIWFSYLIIIRPMYTFLLYHPADMNEDLFEDMKMVISELIFNPGFLIRIFLYSFMTRVSLRFFLKILNRNVSSKINLPVECASTNGYPLLLFEAMKSDSSYLVHLAFHQYYSKADVVDYDTMAIFKLSHPGNHALYWEAGFSSVCNCVNGFITNLEKFFMCAKLPPNMGPISHFRRTQIEGQFSARNMAANMHVRTLMRDLAGLQQQPGPQQPVNVTIKDLVIAEIDKVFEDLKRIPSTFAGYILRLLQSSADIVPFPFSNSVVSDELLFSNILYDHMLIYWGLMGTMKLFCSSLRHKLTDPNNVVFQDVDKFLKLILNFYEHMMYVETYLINVVDVWPNTNKELLKRNRRIVSRLSNISLLVLMEIHYNFYKYYDIIGVPPERHQQICEVLSGTNN